jgi:hypothetical protein
MKRPSYLRQIAVPPRADGIVRLAPPRLLFRPSPATPGFTVVEEHAVNPQTARRAAIEPAAPRATSPTPAPLPALPETPAGSIRPPAVHIPRAACGIAAPAAGPAPGPQPTSDPHPPLPSPISAAAKHSKVPPVIARPGLPLPSPIRDGGLPAAPLAVTEAALQGPARRRTEGEPQRILRAKPTAPPPSVPAAESPRGFPPPIPAPRAQPAKPAELPRPPDLALAPPPAVSLLVPPTPPARRPTAERASPGVHIGTLQIRVVAPAAAATPIVPLPAPPSASRPMRSASSTERLARGYGAYGLSQA